MIGRRRKGIPVSFAKEIMFNVLRENDRDRQHEKEMLELEIEKLRLLAVVSKKDQTAIEEREKI